MNGNVAVRLLSSSGSGISGAKVIYRGPDGFTRYLPDTDVSGTSGGTLANTGYAFTVSLRGGSQTRTGVVLTSAQQTVVFTTSPLTVQARSSAGAPLAGAAMSYRAPDGYDYQLGTTLADGQVVVEAVPSTYDVVATYLGGIARRVGVVSRQGRRQPPRSRPSPCGSVS